MPRHDERSRALANAAPTMPDAMPEPTSTLNKVAMMFPIVSNMFNTNEKWRRLVSTINKANSQTGRAVFDYSDAAAMVEQEIANNGANPLLTELDRGQVWFYIQCCLRKVGLSKTQRIRAAHQNLLSGQPAE